MNAIIRFCDLRVKLAVFASAFLAASTACSVIPPQQEHYMLRADYFRGLEEMRKTHDAEKATIRERMTGIQADLAREEGRRIQVENDAEDLRRRLAATQARLDAALGVSERDATAGREEKEMLMTSIERLTKELETTRAAIERMKAVAAEQTETSVVLVSDISFARNATAITRVSAMRIRMLATAIGTADHISVVGHAEARETPDAWRVAAARAAVVAKFLQDALGTPGVKITSVGRGAVAAVGSASNRRVEIIAITRPSFDDGE